MLNARLGEILIEMGAVEPDGLTRALERQRLLGFRLGRCILDLRLCDEEQIVAALAQQYGLDTVVLTERSIPDSLLELIPAALARELKVIPLAVLDTDRRPTLRVAMGRPWDVDAMDRLRRATGFPIRAVLAGDLDLITAVHRHYPLDPPETIQLPDVCLDDVHVSVDLNPVPGWEELTLPPKN